MSTKLTSELDVLICFKIDVASLVSTVLSEHAPIYTRPKTPEESKIYGTISTSVGTGKVHHGCQVATCYMKKSALGSPSTIEPLCLSFKPRRSTPSNEQQALAEHCIRVASAPQLVFWTASSYNTLHPLQPVQSAVCSPTHSLPAAGHGRVPPSAGGWGSSCPSSFCRMCLGTQV